MTRARGAAAALAIVAVAAGVLLAMGRPPICTCGHVALWHGAIDAGNSQHLADWYSPSHLIHGLIFYGLGCLLLRRRPVALRFAIATLIEATWEIVENTPMTIDRYRTATMALGYAGDSVINSIGDIAFMMIGFAIAARVPWQASVAIAIGLELLALAVIRDNLTLNVLMLVWPIAAIRVWQGG